MESQSKGKDDFRVEIVYMRFLLLLVLLLFVVFAFSFHIYIAFTQDK